MGLQVADLPLVKFPNSLTFHVFKNIFVEYLLYPKHCLMSKTGKDFCPHKVETAAQDTNDKQ